jgi:ubiquinone/menaquinone biosynthesis C-methylase UbiE
MTQVTDAAEVDRALKAKHRAIWAMGDYPAVARELVAPLGPILVEAAGVGPGDSVLDIAAGSGNASLPAALPGAVVIASDLPPALLETGRPRAAAAGATIDWVEADAEALPFADGEFDAVISAIGIMFAPHHQAAADELVRVCRPGGSIGLISWTPGGFIGEMFVTMRPYAPPPPPGAQPAPLWGGEDHVRELLGDRVTDVDARVQTLVVDHFAQPEEFREYFKRNYGPTIALYRSLADDPERAAALDRDLDDLARRYGIGDGNARMEWEYLLLTARKRG